MVAIRPASVLTENPHSLIDRQLCNAMLGEFEIVNKMVTFLEAKTVALQNFLIRTFSAKFNK